MSWSSTGRVCGVLLAAIALGGCSRAEKQAYRRIAVLPFEDLSSNAQPAWKGRALGELVAIHLSGLSDTTAVYAATLPAAIAVRSTHVLHGYFDANGVRASLEDFTTHRVVQTAAERGADVAVMASGVAHAMDPSARIAVINASAAQSLAEGKYERAAAAAPDFGPAYVAWANNALARGDRDGAAKALAAARARDDAILPLERARLDLLAATLAGAGARRKALIALSRTDPADPFAFRALAEIDTAARSYSSAIAWFDQAIARDPAPEILNSAAYTHAFGGDLDGAVRLLRRYGELRPGDANVFDSLGEVHYYAGRFADAEKYFLESYARNPAFLGGGALYKAAWARLMAGDLKRASAHAERFFAERAKAGADAVMLRAQWDFITGKRNAAVAALEKIHSPAASVHLAVWAIDAGDRERAQRLTESLPARYAPASVLRTALGDNAGDAPAAARSLGLGWAAMLSGRPEEGVKHFRDLYRITPPASPEPAAVLLAWALIESGRTAEARPLLERNAVPDAIADHPFVALAYPRILELRKRAGVH